jgi:phytoene dehydrogenase-like protein
MRSILLVNLALALSPSPSWSATAHTQTSAAFATSLSRAGISLAKHIQALDSCRASKYLRASEDDSSITSIDDSDDGRVGEEVDVAIIGAGIGGLCAGAILNTLYNKKVGIYESHYLPGGCAHAFERRAENGVTFTFDSGPTIVLGCSKEPFNPLQQVLRAVGVDGDVEWIPYDGWGMVEHPTNQELEKRWKLTVGPNSFEEGPLRTFASSPTALKEFNALREVTNPLVVGASTIPAMAMRPGHTSLVPLLRYLPSLLSIISNGVEVSTGPFAPFMNGPIFEVTDKWLRDWLDALAFSLSGLPAERTSAASMAYVLFDMHREGAALDYPKGGLGEMVKALVRGVEQKSRRNVELGSKVYLRRHVESIAFNASGNRAIGLNVRKGGGGTVFVKAKEGVICNAVSFDRNISCA